eukprot:1933228-Pyramimonas_sp.AAC.1
MLRLRPSLCRRPTSTRGWPFLLRASALVRAAEIWETSASKSVVRRSSRTPSPAQATLGSASGWRSSADTLSQRDKKPRVGWTVLVGLHTQRECAQQSRHALA